MTTPQPTGKRGFTLIELLVAMTITAIIVAVLVSITGTAIDTWNRSREELRASRQAEAMIQIMSKDLESLVIRSGSGQEWLSAILDTDAITPTDIDAASSANAVRLIFFTAATDRYDGQVGVQGQDLGGDISCVGYQLSWKDPVSTGTSTEEFETFVLNRYLVNPDLAFQNLLGQTKANPATSLDTLFVNNYGSRMGDDRHFVCENIFQFTLVFHLETYNAGGELQNQLVSIGTSGASKTEFRVLDDANLLDPFNASDPDDVSISNGVLTAIEVLVTVLGDSAIAQLRGNPTLADDADWLASNSYHFSRLIQVPRK